MKKVVIIAALALCALALNSIAQEEGGPPPDRPRCPHGPPPLPLFMALDANHDGVIDSNEITNAAASLKTLDKNGDGQLTADEYRPQFKGMQPPPPPDTSASKSTGSADGPPPPPPDPIVSALDANQDDVIDASEIANAPSALKALDKNGDGKLTPDELFPPPPDGGMPGDNPSNSAVNL